MANYTTTITNEGAALLASVIANQGTLTFNEFRFSENDYTGQESTLTEGTFLGVFVTASAAASVIDLTTIKASAQFNNSAITGNHNLYSIGIVGTDGNTTALIAVCTTTDPDVIREPLTGTSTYAFNVNLSVSDTSQITVAGTTAAALYDIDVVDNLISTDTDKPLSANQGHLIADNLAADENVYGAKNLGIPLADMTYLNLSTSNSSDGSLTVTTNGLTCGGVSENWSSPFILKKGTYQVSFGLDTDETPSLTGFAVILKVFSTNYWLCTSGDSAASRKITLAADTEVIWGLYCESGTVVATQTVYPMIRDARILDPTFVPFAKTNKQLTDDKAERSDLATLNLTGSTNTTGATITNGTFFYLNGQFCKALTNIAVNATFTENTNYKKDTVGEELKKWTLVASATADGVKTWSQLISEISSLYPATEPYKYIIVIDYTTYHPMGGYSFVVVDGADTNYASIYFRMVSLSSNKFYEVNGALTPTDYSSSVPTGGQTIKLYKIS